MRVQGRLLALFVLLAVAIVAWVRPAAAAAFGDCAPIGTLDNFDASDKPGTRTWNSYDFRVVEGKEAKKVTQYGKTCHQAYYLKSGVRSSNLEIMKNYAEGLPGLGFRITNVDRAEDDEIYATMKKGGTEYWVRVGSSNGNTIDVVVLEVQPFKSTLLPAADTDCAPIGGLDRFAADNKPQTRVFAAENFRVIEGKEAKQVEKSGSTCHQIYGLKHGAPYTSNLEIMKNYAEGLPTLGFTITNTDRGEDDEIYATMKKAGVEYWARVGSSNSNTIDVFVLEVQPFKSTLLPMGDMDCAPIGGLAGFSAGQKPETRDFAEEKFRVVEGKEAKQVAKSGKTCHQIYGLKSGSPNKTDLEIVRNYAEGLPGLGFTITNTDRAADDEIFATMAKDGVETWVHLYASNGNVLTVLVLHIEAFKSSLLPVAPKDCPLVPSLENFAADGPPQTRIFDREAFDTDAGKVTKEGKTCHQIYGLKSGLPPKTDLEIMRNYAEGLPAAGFAVRNAKRDAAGDLVATITKDGVERWVRVSPSNGNTIGVLEVEVAPFVASLAPLGPNDCPPVPSLTDFVAGGPPQTVPFAAMEFHAIIEGKPVTVSKSGKTCHQNYGLKPGVPRKSDLEIAMNYIQALPAAHINIVNTDREDQGPVVGTIMTKDGTESWVEISPANGNSFGVAVLQIEPFKSSMKAAQIVEETPKIELEVTATRDGHPLPGAWCGTFVHTHSPDAAITRADSGKVQEIAKAGTVDVGCFFDEDGKTSIGWLKAQLLSIGKTTLEIEIPAPKTKHAELSLHEPGSSPEKIKPEKGDFPYLKPMPGSTFNTGHASAEPFYVQPEDAKQPELVGIGSIVKEYQPPPGIGLDLLVAAYKEALLKAHWTIVTERHDQGVLLVAHYGENDRNIWAAIHLAENLYSITVADATIAQAELAASLVAKCHLALTGVLFDFDKSSLKPESDAVLTQVAALMVKKPKLKLEIQGHTDNVGTEAYNLTLSEQRAGSVVAWLVQHKVEPNRLTARGYGKTRPIASNDTDAGRAQNRRVEIEDPVCKK